MSLTCFNGGPGPCVAGTPCCLLAHSELMCCLFLRTASHAPHIAACVINAVSGPTAPRRSFFRSLAPASHPLCGRFLFTGVPRVTSPCLQSYDSTAARPRWGGLALRSVWAGYTRRLHRQVLAPQCHHTLQPGVLDKVLRCALPAAAAACTWLGWCWRLCLLLGCCFEANEGSALIGPP